MNNFHNAISVLVVDDNPNNLSLLVDTLDNSGYTVLVALDGKEGLERARAAKPNIILLDVMMPGLDGFETCRRLKHDPALQDIPVIFMTARDETEALVEGLSLGAIDYVRKPVKPAEVIARISTHVHSTRRLLETRSAMEATGKPTIAAYENGSIAWITPHARDLLEKYFPYHVPDRYLPEELTQWLSRVRQGDTQAFVCQSREARLSIYNYIVDNGSELLLQLVEEDAKITTAALAQTFHLTERESEVLLWVAYGKTNSEIGQILSMSPRTVNKHLEHIFRKLGIETRTAAAAAVLRVKV